MLTNIGRTKRSPMIFIPAADHDRLSRLASVAGLCGSPVAEFLATELDRAIVRPADEIAGNIVTMNSRVAFRVGPRRKIEIRTLVYPDEHAPRQPRDDCVSVMTPLGAALIGLRVGSGMAYEAFDSTIQYVTVEAVIHQPATDRGPDAGRDDRDRGPSRAHRGGGWWNDDDPWTRSPREATAGRPGDDELRNLTAELRRLRQELRAVRETVRDSAGRPA